MVGDPVIELEIACNSKLSGVADAAVVAAVCDPAEALNSPLACCSCRACSLNFTTSREDAPASFDCSEVEERTEVTEDDPVFDSA